MSLVEVGRVCVKTHGRETGHKCVVVERIDKSFVLITGPKEVTGVRRRRANVDHLTPTKKKVDIKAGAEDQAVMKALEGAKLQDFMKEKTEE
ncbi:MAG: 50S ribosomal protein L14e [Candidatus Hodarchaeota archaeon]